MTRSDLVSVARLCGELGYPVSAEGLEPRFASVEASERDVVLVAESDDAGILGWIHVAVDPVLTHGAAAEVKGLVVGAAARGRGIGRRLLEAAEAWSRERGCDEVRLRSRVTREDAHRFYEACGYRRLKTQHAFSKELS